MGGESHGVPQHGQIRTGESGRGEGQPLVAQDRDAGGGERPHYMIGTGVKDACKE